MDRNTLFRPKMYLKCSNFWAEIQTYRRSGSGSFTSATVHESGIESEREEKPEVAAVWTLRIGITDLPSSPTHSVPTNRDTPPEEGTENGYFSKLPERLNVQQTGASLIALEFS